MTNQTIEKYNIGTTHTIQRRDFKNIQKSAKLIVDFYQNRNLNKWG